MLFCGLSGGSSISACFCMVFCMLRCQWKHAHGVWEFVNSGSTNVHRGVMHGIINIIVAVCVDLANVVGVQTAVKSGSTKIQVDVILQTTRTTVPVSVGHLSHHLHHHLLDKMSGLFSQICQPFSKVRGLNTTRRSTASCHPRETSLFRLAIFGLFMML